MNIMNTQTVIDTIKANRDSLYSAEQKVADYILANPEKAVNLNVSDIADASGVSDATVVRFCKRLGYQGYYQLKLCLSHDIGRNQIINSEYKGESLNALNEILNGYAADIIGIGKNIDYAVVEQCTENIRNSNFVHIVAVGNTSPLAQYMGFRLGRLGIKSTYNMLPEYFMNQVNLADPKDIVIAISQSGSSKPIVQAVELAKEKNLKVIAITAYKNSPLSRLADFILISGTKKMQDEFSYYQGYAHFRETALIDALLELLTNKENIIKSSADKPEIILSEYKM